MRIRSYKYNSERKGYWLITNGVKIGFTKSKVKAINWKNFKWDG